MSASDELISINVTIDIHTATLQTIVENAKIVTGPDEKEIYRVDTADKVNQLVSSFLKKYAFDEYVDNIDNYERS